MKRSEWGVEKKRKTVTKNVVKKLCLRSWEACIEKERGRGIERLDSRGKEGFFF